MNDTQLRRRRAEAQLLYRRDELAPAEVVSHILAVQSQDRRGGKLALRARSGAFAADDVERALTDERSLVITWLMRGTIHLVCPDDYPWLLALTAPTRVTAIRRRLRQEGVSEDQEAAAVAAIDRALRQDGPLSRSDLRERMQAQNLPFEGQGAAYLIGAASYAGLAVVGPQRSGKSVHVSVAEWLGEDIASKINKVDRDTALAELARRYLASRGPATVADIAYWSGLPQRDIRRGLEAIAPELAGLDGDLLDLKKRRTTDLGTAPPRLLHTWDDYMLAWKDRSFMLPDQHKRAVIWGGGMFASTATVDGLVAGGWSAPLSRKPFAVDVEPFETLTKKAAAALKREAADIARFEGR
jgi:hypothetical protein